MSGIGHNNSHLDLDGGWVAVTRKLRDHWLVGFGQPVPPQDPQRGSLSRAEAFLDLIMECRYKDGYVMNGGHKMLLVPGQLVGATSYLAARWNWSPKTVRVWLDRLSEEKMISLAQPGLEEGKQKGKQSTVITVCNFTYYQNLPIQDGQAKEEQEGEQEASKGQAKGKQRASRGQQYKEGTREQGNKSPPPTPPGLGEGAGTGVSLFGEKLPDEIAGRKQIEEAFSVYNLAAEHFRFGKCEVLTTKRYERLQTRIKDLGGLENFKLALRALGNRDQFCKFLLGRTPARAGREPFRLTLEMLLQTDGNMGDVLVRLFEISKQATGPNGGDAGDLWWKDQAKVAAMTDAQWKSLIAKHANGVWPTRELGPAPGNTKCLVPRNLVRELYLEDRYTPQGISRQPH